MSRGADRDLAAKLKAKVALAALRGDKTVAELAREYNLDPKLIAEWKAHLEQHADACFRVDAPRRLLFALAKDDPPTVPPWPSRPRPPTLTAVVPAAALPEDDLWDDITQTNLAQSHPPGQTTIDTISGAATPARPKRPASSARRLLGPLFAGWHEKRHAANVSRELLKLYQRVGLEQPGLTKPERYRRIVMARQAGTAEAADEVLAHATESFANWPVERALNFRDVVHYLAVTEYFASNNPLTGWTRENLGRVVARYIPENL